MDGLESLVKIVEICGKKKKDKNDGHIIYECLNQIKNELKDYYRLVSRMKFNSEHYKKDINSKHFKREPKINKYIAYNLDGLTDAYLSFVNNELKDKISDTYWSDHKITKK